MLTFVSGVFSPKLPPSRLSHKHRVYLSLRPRTPGLFPCLACCKECYVNIGMHVKMGFKLLTWHHAHCACDQVEVTCMM